jgi:hypothetical protein
MEVWSSGNALKLVETLGIRYSSSQLSQPQATSRSSSNFQMMNELMPKSDERNAMVSQPTINHHSREFQVLLQLLFFFQSHFILTASDDFSNARDAI